MKTNSAVKLNWFTVIVLLVFWLICASFYPSLPAEVPTHWNIQGQPDGHSNKIVASLIMPLLPLAIYLLMTFVPRFDPKKENYEKFAPTYEKIRLAIVLILGSITLLPILVGKGYDLNISLIMRVVIPSLFIYLGNYMGKIRFNYLTGIRVPWTLANEEVWNKTHRLGGKLMVAGGILSLTSILTTPKIGFIILMAGVLGPILIATIYSYLLYLRLDNKGY